MPLDIQAASRIQGKSALSLTTPDPRWIELELEHLDKKIRTKVLRAALRSAAGVMRKRLRAATKAEFKRGSGDLLNSVKLQIKKHKGNLLALVGFNYDKSKYQETKQIPAGIYAHFLDEGATRHNRGKLRATHFATNVAKDEAVLGEAIDAFGKSLSKNLHKLRGGHDGS